MNHDEKPAVILTDSSTNRESIDVKSGIGREPAANSKAYDAAKPSNPPLEFENRKTDNLFSGERFQNLYCSGLQSALEIQKSWIDYLAHFNLSALETWTKSFWFLPGTTAWYDLAGQSLATMVETQKSMMDMAVEQTRTAASFTERLPEEAHKQARRSVESIELFADTFERGMDMLVGTQKELFEIAASPWKTKAAEAA